jgi:Flp pilus assembly protein TadG
MDFEAPVSRDGIARRGRRGKRRGTAAVELALSAPLLIFFVAMVVETCHALHVHQSMALSAYEGARRAIQRNATTADAIDKAEHIADVRKLRDVTVDVSPSVESAVAGEILRVTIYVDADANAMMFGRMFMGDTVEYSVAMMKEY